LGGRLNPALDIQQIRIGHRFSGQRQVDQHQKAVTVGVQGQHLELVAGGKHTAPDQRLANHRKQLFTAQDTLAAAWRDHRQGGLAKQAAAPF